VVCGDARLAVETGDSELGSYESYPSGLGGTGNLKVCGDTLLKGACDAFLFREVEVSTGFPVSFDGCAFSRCRDFGADVKVHSTPLISQNLPVIVVSTKWAILTRRFGNHACGLSISAYITRPVFPASRPPRVSMIDRPENI
jgi:hypothetical protein